MDILKSLEEFGIKDENFWLYFCEKCMESIRNMSLIKSFNVV